MLFDGLSYLPSQYTIRKVPVITVPEDRTSNLYALRGYIVVFNVGGKASCFDAKIIEHGAQHRSYPIGTATLPANIANNKSLRLILVYHFRLPRKPRYNALILEAATSAVKKLR